eukprot:gene26913-4530_t
MYAGGEDFSNKDDARPSTVPTGGQQELMTEADKKTLLRSPAASALIDTCVRRLMGTPVGVTAESVLDVLKGSELEGADQLASAMANKKGAVLHNKEVKAIIADAVLQYANRSDPLIFP